MLQGLCAIGVDRSSLLSLVRAMSTLNMHVHVDPRLASILMRYYGHNVTNKQLANSVWYDPTEEFLQILCRKKNKR